MGRLYIDCTLGSEFFLFFNLAGGKWQLRALLRPSPRRIRRPKWGKQTFAALRSNVADADFADIPTAL